MKMTKKVLGIVLCGVMTVGMLTGCGGSDSSTTNDAGRHQQMQHRKFQLYRVKMVPVHEALS